MTTRWLDIDGMHNVRDLGGLPLRRGTTVRGVVVRGETTAHLTDVGAQQLRAHGVGRVLDLRERSERLADGDGALADAYASGEVVHENVPLLGLPVNQDIIGHAADSALLAARYQYYLDHGGARLAGAITRAAWDPSALYVHCAVGKDRTGVACALLLDLAGAEPDVIVDDFLQSRERLDAVIDQLQERPAYAYLAGRDRSDQVPDADAMHAFLRALTASGGARGWLHQHGAETDTLDLLANRLRGEAEVSRRAV